MRDQSLRRIVAAERHRARTVAACSGCGTEDPVVLVEGSDPPACYQCREIARGRSGVERHHIGAEPSPIVVEVGANLHRRLTIVQDLTWRALGADPGSAEATLIDLLALRALRDLA